MRIVFLSKSALVPWLALLGLFFQACWSQPGASSTPDAGNRSYSEGSGPRSRARLSDSNDNRKLQNSYADSSNEGQSSGSSKNYRGFEANNVKWARFTIKARDQVNGTADKVTLKFSWATFNSADWITVTAVDRINGGLIIVNNMNDFDGDGKPDTVTFNRSDESQKLTVGGKAAPSCASACIKMATKELPRGIMSITIDMSTARTDNYIRIEGLENQFELSPESVIVYSKARANDALARAMGWLSDQTNQGLVRWLEPRP